MIVMAETDKQVARLPMQGHGLMGGSSCGAFHRDAPSHGLRLPWSGLSSEAVLDHIAYSRQNEAGFAVWGTELARVWMHSLRPGERVRFRDVRSAVGFLQCVAQGKQLGQPSLAGGCQ